MANGHASFFKSSAKRAKQSLCPRLTCGIPDDAFPEACMSYSIHLNKAIAVAKSITVRPDRRCFGRLTSA